MCEESQKIARLEVSVTTIIKTVDEIKANQQKILDRGHVHDLESERYRVLIDEIVEEKRVKIARVEAITDKLITGGLWSAAVLLLTLAWHGLKGKIGG